MHFDILDEIDEIETFATGRQIRELARLNRIYGKARWRKRKGFTTIRLKSGEIHHVELHWYEATGIGKKEIKIKQFLNKL
jgi:hypothetical protein